MSELSILNLPYETDLSTHYQSLCHLPGFVLLESTDQKWGRYDIATAYPYQSLKLSSQNNSIAEAFKTLKNHLSPTTRQSSLPFQGGAIGYISYDFAAEMAGLHSKKHPLLADLPILNLGFYDWAIIADHLQKKVYLIAAHQQPDTRMIIEEILERWHQPPSELTFSLQKSFAPILSKDDYQASFHAIYEDLKKGRAYQVNLTQPFIAEYFGDSWMFYRRVSRKNPTPYAAFLRLADAEIISFSPERFLTMDEQTILASPIKGSARRAKDSHDDLKLKNALLDCEKNRAENTMIVDLLRNDLGKIAIPGSVCVKSLCAVQSFNSVHHLVSDISAQCRVDISLVDAFAACFPGGSITGAPKLEAMKIIAEQEPYARGVYCGSIGYFSNHGRFDTNIAIRTVTAGNNHLYLSAGGGIVIDSDCGQEYQECYTKIKAITDAFLRKGQAHGERLK